MEIIFCCWLVRHRNPFRNASQTSRSIEAVIAAGAGIAAGSIALVGFGLDSLVEVFAASITLWHLRGVDEQREQRALRLCAELFAVAAYVVVEIADPLTGLAITALIVRIAWQAFRMIRTDHQDQ